ncbi:MAG TPA: VOC family protein [Polyangiales bacterium]|nr:VOC family protein [Polyangiales bacterium]
MNTPGRIMFHELNTHDLKGARAFYGPLFDWRFEARDDEYFYIKCGESMVAAMFKLPPPDAPPHWLPYISVSTVEDGIAQATAAGCKQLVPAMEVDAGRFSIFMDPQGAVFCAWQGHGGELATASQAVGSFVWDQLNTPDPAASQAAYARMFDWKTQAFPGMSELSTFVRGDQQLASLMQGPAGMPAHWLAYIRVENLSETREHAAAAGGKVMVEEIRVPQMGAFSVLQDPEGALFAVFTAA